MASWETGTKVEGSVVTEYSLVLVLARTLVSSVPMQWPHCYRVEVMR